MFVYGLQIVWIFTWKLSQQCFILISANGKTTGVMSVVQSKQRSLCLQLYGMVTTMA